MKFIIEIKYCKRSISHKGSKGLVYLIVLIWFWVSEISYSNKSNSEKNFFHKGSKWLVNLKELVWVSFFDF